MSGEVFCSLCGTEAELRRLSAEDYLRAKAEAREIGAELASDEESGTLIFAACLVSRGAYDGENRMFSSVLQALSELSAKELMSVAAEYFPEYPKTAGGAEDADGMSGRGYGGRNDSEHSGMKTGSFPSELGGISARKNGGGRTPYASWRREPRRASPDERRGEYGKAGGLISASTASGGASMQDVSDFFERDARRYPAGFERY